MLKILAALARRATRRSASPRESISAGHGLHRPISAPAAPATLSPDRRGRLKNGNRCGGDQNHTDMAVLGIGGVKHVPGIAQRNKVCQTACRDMDAPEKRFGQFPTGTTMTGQGLCLRTPVTTLPLKRW